MLTPQILKAWAKYEIGKPCRKHPEYIVKNGKYGNWCGAKDDLGRWCNGSMPTPDFISNFEKNDNNK